MLKRVCKIAPGGFCTRKEASVAGAELPCGNGESDAAKLEICPTAQIYFLGLITSKEIVPNGGATVEMTSAGFSKAIFSLDGKGMREIESGSLIIH